MKPAVGLLRTGWLRSFVMSEWKVRSRIARSLIASPLVGVAIGLGYAAWFSGSLLGADGRFLVWLGVLGLLFGIATAVTSWRRHGPQIRRAAAEVFRDVSNRNHEQFLNDLERRLRVTVEKRAGPCSARLLCPAVAHAELRQRI